MTNDRKVGSHQLISMKMKVIEVNQNWKLHLDIIIWKQWTRRYIIFDAEYPLFSAAGSTKAINLQSRSETQWERGSKIWNESFDGASERMVSRQKVFNIREGLKKK